MLLPDPPMPYGILFLRPDEIPGIARDSQGRFVATKATGQWISAQVTALGRDKDEQKLEKFQDLMRGSGVQLVTIK